MRMTEQEIERLAHKRATAKLGWYIHALVYVVVNVAMLTFSHLSDGRRWSLAPVLGWGLGVVLHGVAVFVLGQGGAWRERLVERERERLRRDRRP